jgi:MerR family transcriptional regulator/heat shock protein HspR
MRVAAELVGMHPQTLRKYERAGLLAPTRSKGYHRLYSDDDLSRLSSIRHLVHKQGVNVAGVRLLLAVLDSVGEIERSLQRDRGGVTSVERHVRTLRTLLEPDRSEATQ